MKIRRNWPFCLLLILIGVFGTRLAWTLTASVTGWQPHLDHWADVARDLVGIEQIALSDQEPATQAKFWLGEVETIEAAKHDPMVAMGAAWMLDAPQFGFIWHHMRTNEDPDMSGLPASWRRELDRETINALSEEFELLCRDERLSRIETAVRLDDSNVELWRARALLLFLPTNLGGDSVPRREDWLTTLDECAAHDPENALYDYLAAFHLWSSSAEYDWQEDGLLLEIEDHAWPVTLLQVPASWRHWYSYFSISRQCPLLPQCWRPITRCITNA